MTYSLCFKVDDKEPVSAELVAPDDAVCKDNMVAGNEEGRERFCGVLQGECSVHNPGLVQGHSQ